MAGVSPAPRRNFSHYATREEKVLYSLSGVSALDSGRNDPMFGVPVGGDSNGTYLGIFHYRFDLRGDGVLSAGAVFQGTVSESIKFMGFIKVNSKYEFERS